MKTSRSNSFRLHRLTKTNSLNKTQAILPEQTLNLYAINSINKGVKYNDLTSITGRQLNKLRKQPTVDNDLVYQSAHNNMMQMRKKYDDMKKQCLAKQVTIFHLKEDKQRYQLKKNTFDGGKNQGKQKVQTFQHLLNQKKQLLQKTQIQKKVLKNMRNKYQIDKIFYDQRKFDLQKQLQHYKKQMKIFQKQGIQFNENTDRTSKIYDKLLKQLQSQNNQRQSHLSTLLQMIQNKVGIIQQNQIRGQQIQSIAQRAMLDKNLSEKQWQKLFLTNVFVNKMLRNKIQRQMEKFTIVQFAFKQIKTATGINDAQVLVEKYLNKQQVYGELLGKISENQKRIEQLRSQNQNLLDEQKSLQMEKQVLQSTKITHEDLRTDLKVLQNLQEKAINDQLLEKKFINWLLRQIKKLNYFDKNDKKSQPNLKAKTKQQIIELFKQYQLKMNDSFNIANQIKIEQISLGSQIIQSDRLSRVIPKINKKSSALSQNYENQNIDQEQTNTSNLAQQNDVITTQRQQVIRNNQKFMKQLKRKRLEMKKIIVQMMKQKVQDKPKVPQPKKDQ